MYGGFPIEFPIILAKKPIWRRRQIGGRCQTRPENPTVPTPVLTGGPNPNP